MRTNASSTDLERGALALIDLALAEDVGSGDITTLSTVPAHRRASGVFLARSDGVISGLACVHAVYARVDPEVIVNERLHDGDVVQRGDIIASVEGPARALLTGERVALNFLQRLSGVATITREYVRAVEGTNARIIDTRKTTPGMRTLQKQAIRHGGGHNHRLGLADGVLIKDNHLQAIGTANRVTRAIQAARDFAPHTLKIEVEVTTLEQLDEALAAKADVILLDNMDAPTMAEAVRRTAGRALLEASGGITLETLRTIAETGVDLISAGALTHSAPSLDISLELDLSES